MRAHFGELLHLTLRVEALLHFGLLVVEDDEICEWAAGDTKLIDAVRRVRVCFAERRYLCSHRPQTLNPERWSTAVFAS